jgi:hypothetical protein
MRAKFNEMVGRYRTAHLSLVQHCEAVVAYGGEGREKANLAAVFERTQAVRLQVTPHLPPSHPHPPARASGAASGRA